MGDVSGSQNIANAWGIHYKKLLNSVANNEHNIQEVNEYINEISFENDSIYVTVSDIICALKTMKLGKSAGSDGVSTEAFRYAHGSLIDMLASCFTAMLSHGHLPVTFMHCIVRPIVKNKKVNLSDWNNYRPISIASSASKIFETVIFMKAFDCLHTTSAQFGFKKKLSTLHAVYALKEICHSYTTAGGPVYLCFLDASKAFDRVNHSTLFSKLMYRGMPPVLLRLLKNWYQNQTLQVLWCNKLSVSFTVSNGVREGGVLSPYLFNIYNDDLSIKLSECNVGCAIGTTFINHLFYADDMVLIAPCGAALQILIDHCEDYASKHDIIFSTSKSKCMVMSGSMYTPSLWPIFRLCGSIIKYCNCYPYLGCTISSDLRDDEAMKSQLKLLYIRTNTLLFRFVRCCINTKITLFKAYACQLYGCALWTLFYQYNQSELKIAHNNALRRLLNIRGMCSISERFVALNIPNYDVMIRKATSLFIISINTVSFVNFIIGEIKQYYSYNYSLIWTHWLQICYCGQHQY